ncbi:hypothetical protein L211DRAFT_871833 [Terfezia boudieri ATCC MYA-4762]|uniref:Uncharacterized protein n=1 Tax=Terfezia boudieri ATCC MYA-4762 TaxID=1051890 RepID=A0A3N4L722_9PEZI|nr:hypothetical protein L211DRAFT_871833 [Terfezia boudieri ATCC MYA-4762]
MPGKGKRKDNPGKMDRVNPPYKTRIPVTDHPEPQHSTPNSRTLRPPSPPPRDGYESDTSDTSVPLTESEIEETIEVFNNSSMGFVMIMNRLIDDMGQDGDVWGFALAELHSAMVKAFGTREEIGTTSSIQEGAARYKKELITTILRKYSQVPPTPAPTTTRTTGTQTTPSITPTSNSISTNTDPPKSPPVTHTSSQTTPPTPNRSRPPTASPPIRTRI